MFADIMRHFRLSFSFEMTLSQALTQTITSSAQSLLFFTPNLPNLVHQDKQFACKIPYCSYLPAFNPIVYSTGRWVFATMRTESKRLYTFSANRYLTLKYRCMFCGVVICLAFPTFLLPCYRPALETTNRVG